MNLFANLDIRLASIKDQAQSPPLTSEKRLLYAHIGGDLEQIPLAP